MANYTPINASADDVPLMLGGNTAILFTQEIDLPLPRPASYVRQSPWFSARSGLASLTAVYDAGETGITIEPDPETGTLTFSVHACRASGMFTATITATSKGGPVSPPYYALQAPEDGEEDTRLRPCPDYWQPVTRSYTVQVVVLGADEPWATGPLYAFAEVGRPFHWSVPLKTSFGNHWNTYYTSIAASTVENRYGGGLEGEYVFGDLKLLDGETSTGLTTRNTGRKDDGQISWGPVEVMGVPTVAGVAQFDIEITISGFAMWNTWTGGFFKIPVVVYIAPTFWPEGRPVLLLPRSDAADGVTLSGLSIGTPDLNGGLRDAGIVFNDRPIYAGSRSVLSWAGETTYTLQMAYVDEDGFEGWILYYSTVNPTKANSLFYCPAPDKAGVVSDRPPVRGWIDNGSGYTGELRLLSGDYYATSASDAVMWAGWYDRQGTYKGLPWFAQAGADGDYVVHALTTSGTWALAHEIGGDPVCTSGTTYFPPDFAGNGPALRANDGYVAAAYVPPRLLEDYGEPVLPAYAAGTLGSMALCYAPTPESNAPVLTASDAAGVTVLTSPVEFWPRHWQMKTYPWAEPYTASFAVSHSETYTRTVRNTSDSGSRGARCDKTDPANPQKQWREFPRTETSETVSESWSCNASATQTPELELMGVVNNRVNWLEHRSDAAPTPTCDYSYSRHAQTKLDGETTSELTDTAAPGNYTAGTGSLRLHIQPYSAAVEGSDRSTEILTFGELSVSRPGSYAYSTTTTAYDGESSSTVTTDSSRSAGYSGSVRGINTATPIELGATALPCPCTSSSGSVSKSSTATLSRAYHALSDGTARVVSEVRSESIHYDGIICTRTFSWATSERIISFDAETGEITSDNTDSDSDSGTETLAEYRSASAEQTVATPTGDLFFSWTSSDEFSETISETSTEVSIL